MAGEPGGSVASARETISANLGDLAVLSEDPCPCGRTFPRGANAYPGAVDAVVQGHLSAGGSWSSGPAIRTT
ncbi:hypothetical protein [Amycolatopsis jejuensis]|uniref:hypothetical protein n=1 Tax=Amycolatopsis jejuensis TaxID=330084 RepID=UPI0012E052C5|nr:hypothetical protein [Amycolatopsis jejuensis]